MIVASYWLLLLVYVQAKVNRAALTDDERAKELPELQSTGWTTVEGKDAIEKHFLFKNFNQVPICTSICVLKKFST